MDINTILTSAVIAGLVAAYVALRSLWAKIAIENITQERAKWRDKIREKSALIHKAIIESDSTKLSEYRAELTLLLNPLDQDDNEILYSIKVSPDSELQAKEFSERVGLLLKHDWERAKLEAAPLFSKTKWGHDFYRDIWHETVRTKYKGTQR
jgi:hypothetical protein